MTVVALFAAPERCAYCDRPFGTEGGNRKTRDHIVPRSFIRDMGRENIVFVCGPCNRAKGHMLPGALREMAEEHRAHAAAYTSMADRVEALIAERGLLPGGTK